MPMAYLEFKIDTPYVLASRIGISSIPNQCLWSSRCYTCFTLKPFVVLFSRESITSSIGIRTCKMPHSVADLRREGQPLPSTDQITFYFILLFRKLKIYNGLVAPRREILHPALKQKDSLR